MNPGINPNWLEAHESSQKEKVTAKAILNTRLDSYIKNVNKDYLAELNKPSSSDSEKNDAEFAPLLDFLAANFPEAKDNIMDVMMFMGVHDCQFQYKNEITRDYIVFDRTGNVFEQEADALYFITDVE